ncbi:hypothetical protein Vadar_022041 [Vaccinium darrowii]|uniref:Uncharacterized protein n=1 Tax=Vaccinium darrowii TaxID=229202 RepID=A0ACB7ZDU8_9ERIC|nr:hypothetical protein Vadar_022041 [Vaccinium darrowii]
MMSNTSLEDTYSLRRGEVKKTIRDLHSKIGTAVEISQVVFLTEFNMVMSMLWGSTVDSNIATEFQAVTLKILEVLSKPNMSTNREEGFEEDGLLSKGKKDFLQILMELKEQEDAAMPITLPQLKSMLLEIVIGSTDTTATMVEWVMAELVHRPEVMKKVQEELSDIVGLNKVAEESHVPKLHYLDTVFKETFRLHPALPLLIPKRPSQSSIVSGYTIPKDTKVFLNVWAMHRNPEAWDDPSEFKPERFLSYPCKFDYSGNNFQFLPFDREEEFVLEFPWQRKW